MAYTNRPTKTYSSKYSSSKPSDQGHISGHFSITDSSNKARSSLKQVYIKYKATPYMTNQPEHVRKMAEATEMFMVKSEPEKRLSEYSRNIMDLSLEDCVSLEQLKGVTRGFGILEEYALKLAWYPWKKQLQKIKVHAAYVTMYVEPYIKGFKDIFRKLGYKRNDGDELVIERLPERDVIMAIAFDCYVAHKEMEIYLVVFSKVLSDGYSVRDVHDCRLKCKGNDNDCVNWIVTHCTPKPKPTFSLTSTDYETKVASSKTKEAVVFYKADNKRAGDGGVLPGLDKGKVERLKVYEEEVRTASDSDYARSAGVSLPRETDYLQNIGSNLPRGSEYTRSGGVNLSGQSDYSHRTGTKVPPVVPPRGSSSSSVSANQPTAVKTFEVHAPMPFIDGHRPSEFKAGTLDEHVTESLRHIEVSDPRGTGAHRPSPVTKGREEWSAVYKTMENMGEKYYDPGGRGDILKGDEMVPKDDDDEEFPPPPKPEELNYRPPTSQSRGTGYISGPVYNPSKDALDAIQHPQTSGYGSKPTEVTSTQSSRYDGTSARLPSTQASSRSDGQNIPRVNLMHNADIYSPDTETDSYTSSPATAKLASPRQPQQAEGFSSNLGNYNASVTDQPQSLKIKQDPFSNPASIQSTFSNLPDSGVSSQNFSTFGRGYTGNIPTTKSPTFDSQTRGNDDPDYVQLKQVTSPGKPSFERNFQSTTQRLYEAQSNSSLARQSSTDGGGSLRITVGQSRDISGLQSREPTATKTREGMTTRSQSHAQAGGNQSRYHQTSSQSRGLNSGQSRDQPDGQPTTRRRHEAENWQCVSCTFSNLGSATQCEMCGKSRVKGAEEDPMNVGGSQCRKCTLVNQPGAKLCETCDTPLKDSATFV